MKTIKEIIQSNRISIMQEGLDGGSGIIQMPLWEGTVIWSTGAGWEHVSVSPRALRITPSWDDMCRLKDIFFYDDEEVIQIHPKKNMYVNNVQNCLHLWRCTYKNMVLPPSVLVGVRKEQTPEQVRVELKKAYEMAGEKFE